MWFDHLAEESLAVALDAILMRFGSKETRSRDVLAEVVEHECRSESESESEGKNHGCIYGARLCWVLESVVECYGECWKFG